MYEYKNLLVNTAEDGITTVTINRPKALNALDTLTLEEMKDCFNRLASDVATKSVLITGAGPKSFVAGADLGAMSKMTVTEARCFSVLGHAVFNAIERIPVAVVAAINGFALAAAANWPLPVISVLLPTTPNLVSRKSTTASFRDSVAPSVWPALSGQAKQKR